MARFVMLLDFTEKGIANVKDSPSRKAAFRAAAAKAGITVEAIYWLLGEHDGMVIMNAPDEHTATAQALSLAPWAMSVPACVAPLMRQRSKLS